MPYLSRHDPNDVAWRKDVAGKDCRIQRGTGVELSVGSGFGCLVLRREVIESHAFQISPGQKRIHPALRWSFAR